MQVRGAWEGAGLALQVGKGAVVAGLAQTIQFLAEESLVLHRILCL